LAPVNDKKIDVVTLAQIRRHLDARIDVFALMPLVNFVRVSLLSAESKLLIFYDNGSSFSSDNILAHATAKQCCQNAKFWQVSHHFEIQISRFVASDVF
jgi:hypothetical protein